jgi:hypothetical protein
MTHACVIEIFGRLAGRLVPTGPCGRSNPLGAGPALLQGRVTEAEEAVHQAWVWRRWSIRHASGCVMRASVSSLVLPRAFRKRGVPFASDRPAAEFRKHS